MKVTGNWLENPATQAVCKAIMQDGAQALFVGGCVRNSLLGVAVSDIDIATDATPETVIALAERAGIKSVPTGIDHGTVTLVNDGIPHEITTFRRDVETDGRRAIVAFSTQVEEDAARRDFTMNALYAQADGTLLDPIPGLPDLRARRVRFIGDAEARIREDYLRSLRFFRFHAWYGDAQEGMDADAIAAIAANLDGIDKVSRERIGAEMLKLLAAPDPAPSVAGMRSTGLLAHILPGADDHALGPLIAGEEQAGIAADPIRRLAALGSGDLSDALRLSRVQARRLHELRDAAAGTMGAAELGYRLKAKAASDALLLRSAFLEQALNTEDLTKAEAGADATFPVSAADLIDKFSGPALGVRLADLEARWIASGFKLTREQLLLT